MEVARRALLHDREAEVLGARVLSGGVCRCDHKRVATQSELLRVGDSPLEGNLVPAGVAGEGERAPGQGALAGVLAAVLLALRDASAVDLAPAHLLSERKADARLLVERERERRAERGELVLAREAGQSLALPPAAVGLGSGWQHRRGGAE